MVALLQSAGGEPFATGATEYLYRPLPARESTPRLILPVEIEGIAVMAILDTGSPYVICTRDMARLLQLSPAAALETKRLQIRGIFWDGYLHRVNVRFLATAGASLDVSATAFVPDPALAEGWHDLPPFIGLGCLERMRFAVDPATDLFFFGAV